MPLSLMEKNLPEQVYLIIEENDMFSYWSESEEYPWGEEEHAYRFTKEREAIAKAEELGLKDYIISKVISIRRTYSDYV